MSSAKHCACGARLIDALDQLSGECGDCALAGLVGVSDPFDDPVEGLVRCDCCGGKFLREDMDGDHCLECAGDLFGSDGDD